MKKENISFILSEVERKLKQVKDGRNHFPNTDKEYAKNELEFIEKL